MGSSWLFSHKLRKKDLPITAKSIESSLQALPFDRSNLQTNELDLYVMYSTRIAFKTGIPKLDIAVNDAYQTQALLRGSASIDSLAFSTSSHVKISSSPVEV